MPWLSAGTLRWLMWVIVGLLVVNTLGNATAPHPVERFVMGSVTLVLALLGTVVALGRERKPAPDDLPEWRAHLPGRSPRRRRVRLDSKV
jgi:hypothetical protein